MATAPPVIQLPPGMTLVQYYEKMLAEQRAAANKPAEVTVVSVLTTGTAPPPPAKPDIPIPIPPADVVPPTAPPTATPAVPPAPSSFDRFVKAIEELTPPEKLFAGMTCELLQQHVAHLYHECRRLGQENILLKKEKMDLETFNLNLQTKLLDQYRDELDRKAAAIDPSWSAKKRKESPAEEKK